MSLVEEHLFQHNRDSSCFAKSSIFMLQDDGIFFISCTNTITWINFMFGFPIIMEHE